MDFDFDFAPRCRRRLCSRLVSPFVALPSRKLHTHKICCLWIVSVSSGRICNVLRATCYVQRAIKCSTTKAFQIQIQIQIAASADPNLQRGPPKCNRYNEFPLVPPLTPQRATCNTPQQRKVEKCSFKRIYAPVLKCKATTVENTR